MINKKLLRLLVSSTLIFSVLTSFQSAAYYSCDDYDVYDPYEDEYDPYYDMYDDPYENPYGDPDYDPYDPYGWDDIDEDTYYEDESSVDTPSSGSSGSGITTPKGSDIGLTAGDFRVNEAGSATYNVNLALPQGIAGVTPSISLAYDSSAGYGPLGNGWQISGLSVISRCRQTPEQDGAYVPSTLTNSDRFCLDGQKLIAVDGAYGESGTEYRTEIASQKRIISLGNQGNGPAHFTVESADGSISYYGNTDTSEAIRNDAIFSATEDETIVSWHITSTSDNLEHEDSSIFFHYVNGDVGFGKNEIVIDKIEYSKNTVDFVYLNEHDSSFDRDNNPPRHFYNKEIETTALLHKVVIKNHHEKAVKSYHLRYSTSALSQLFKVDSLQECNGSLVSDGGKCLQPLTFDWGNTIPPFSGTRKSLDVNLRPGGEYDIPAILTLDLNGDGFNDLAYLEKEDDIYYVYISYFDGTSQEFGTPKYISVFEGDTTEDIYKEKEIPQLKVVDLDGDGRDELLFQKWGLGKHEWYVYDAGSGVGTATWSISKLNTVHHWDKFSFQDVNGDGYPDIRGSENFILNNKKGEFKDFVDPIFVKPSFEPYAYPDGYKSFEGRGHKIYGSSNVDFNGDGISDALFLIRDHYVDSRCPPDEFEYNGVLCHGYIYHASPYLLVKGSDGVYNYVETKVILDQTVSLGVQRYSSAVEFTDLNSDGFTDVLISKEDLDGENKANYLIYYSLGNSFKYAYGSEIDLKSDNGDYFTVRPHHDGYKPVVKPSTLEGLQFLDYNKDGQLDAVYFNKTDKRWEAVYQEDGKFEQRRTILDERSYDAKSIALAMGLNGNGHLSTARYDGNDGILYYNIPKEYPGSQPGLRITKITDGFGVSTDIEYELLTNPEVYSRGYNGNTLKYGRCQLESTDDCSPVFDLIGPQLVVSKVVSNAPGYNASGTTYNSYSPLSVKYSYEGLRAQSGGRGSLGFERLTTEDVQTGIVTSTSYRQDFPYIGMPKETIQKNAKGQILSKSNNVYDYKELHGGKIVAPYLDESTKQKYSVNEHGFQIDVGKVKTKNTYSVKESNHINLTGMTVKTYYSANSGTPFHTATTTNVYDDDDVYNWWLGRLTSTTVEQNRPSAEEQKAVTRTSGFTYEPETGMLSTEEVNGLTTLYCYDDWGNNTTTITHANVGTVDCNTVSADTLSYQKMDLSSLNKIFRRKKVIYDAEGRYPTSIENDKFTTKTIHSRNSVGQVTSFSDANGVKTDMGYDEFGRLYDTRNELGQESTVSRSYSNAFEGAYYLEETTHAGKPSERVYFDKMGRKVATSKQSFDGTWLTNYIRYDSLGRVVNQSSKAGEHYWLSTTYDEYNRITGTTDSLTKTSTSIEYYGLNVYTTVTPGDGSTEQITKKFANVMGETIRVKDNAASQAVRNIEYFYTASGKVHRVTNIDGVSVDTTYDDYGNKTGMVDPDKGTWTYQHNALGELVYQKSARDHATFITRDTVGRTVLKHHSGLGVDDSIDYVYSEALLDTVSNDDQVVSYTYDPLGRIDYVTTELINEGKTYTQQTTYDSHGRVFQQFDPDPYGPCLVNGVVQVNASCYGIQNHYNDYGYLEKKTEAKHGASGKVYYEIKDVDDFGNIVEFTQNDGAITNYKDYDNTGKLEGIRAVTANGVQVQNNTYTFNNLGYLKTRENNTLNSSALGYSEEFIYDVAGRLTHKNGTEIVKYFDNGNIKWKQGVGNYCYQKISRPHAVSAVGLYKAEGCTTSEYQYDANGNMKSGRDRVITYSHFDKPTRITTGSDYTEFTYGVDRSRFKRVTRETIDNKTVTTTTYYIGNVEVEQKSGSSIVTTRRYLPGAVQLTRTNDTSQTHYLLKDYLGSVDTILNKDNQITQKLYFDPWGKKHQLVKADLNIVAQQYVAMSLQTLLHITPRGYTGHESVDHADIIHMNGRIYDPTLGRFLQADPFIQAPENSQSYNRYSYVLNNPMSYTDPSGYFYKWLTRKWGKYYRPIMAVAVTCMTAGAATGWVSSWALGAVSGYMATGTLKGALQGAFTAAAFYGVGSAFRNINTSFGSAGYYGKVAAHGVTGGIVSVLRGGKFGHGFWSAGLTKAVNVNGMIPEGAGEIDYDALRVATAAVIGGTISQITGGKFANGATTAAFAQAFNGNKELAQKGGASLTIHSSGEGLLAGHAWVVYTDAKGNVTTYGTWGNNPNNKGNGLHKNLEAGLTGEASRTLALTVGGQKAFLQTVADYKAMGADAWKLGAPCSSFARDAWHSGTGENLNSNIGPISNPATLKDSIINANGGANHLYGTGPNGGSSASFGSFGRSSGSISITPLGSML